MLKKYIFCPALFILLLNISCSKIPKLSEENINKIKPDNISYYLDYPIVKNGDVNTWNANFNDPGAVIYHDNIFYMYSNGGSRWPQIFVGLFKSKDGINWKEYTNNPVITFSLFDNIESNKPANYCVCSGLFDNDQWILYFIGFDETENWRGNVWRATSKSPEGPWTLDKKPVLLPGDKNEWDKKIMFVNVQKINGKYFMYYNNQNDSAFGLATSIDGINWIKYNNPETKISPYKDSDPIFKLNKNIKSWDSYDIQDPNVYNTEHGWIMIYKSTGTGIGYAISPDGIHWHRPLKNLLIDSKEFKKTISFNLNFIIVQKKAFVFFEEGFSISNIYGFTWNLK